LKIWRVKVENLENRDRKSCNAFNRVFNFSSGGVGPQIVDFGRFPAQPGPWGGLGKAPAGAPLDLHRISALYGFLNPLVTAVEVKLENMKNRDLTNLGLILRLTGFLGFSRVLTGFTRVQ
jgi:hypothetical protein